MASGQKVGSATYDLHCVWLFPSLPTGNPYATQVPTKSHLSRHRIKADGGDQQKFDDAMRVVRKTGVQIWPSPDVMEKMGAKDALCKAGSDSKGKPTTPRGGGGGRRVGIVSRGFSPPRDFTWIAGLDCRLAEGAEGRAFVCFKRFMHSKPHVSERAACLAFAQATPRVLSFKSMPHLFSWQLQPPRPPPPPTSICEAGLSGAELISARWPR